MDIVRVLVHHGGNRHVLEIPEGTSPFEGIRQAIPSFGHACNGNGTCGKCRVRVPEASASQVNPPTEAESRLLGADQVARGHRLACQVRVWGGVDLEVEVRERQAKIAAESGFRMPKPNPFVDRIAVAVPLPSLEDQRSDAARLASVMPQGINPGLSSNCEAIRGPAGASARTKPGLSPELIRLLPGLLRSSEDEVTVTLVDGIVTGLEAGNSYLIPYGVAVDIGTTTLAGSLLNLRDGTVLATETMLNGQKRYGADVIARIRHTMESAHGGTQLRQTILADLRALGLKLCASAGCDPDEVDYWMLTGNTTMSHLLMGWPTAAIASAPFIPACLDRVTVPAGSMWPDAPEQTRVGVLPGVSAYVGADTVSAVLACGLHERETPALVVDLGTNGELVLGSRAGLLACSTAAGPAFEGAGIRYGMGAVDGAIDSVTRNGTAEAPSLFLTVLGNGRAAGLCGTGLLDAIAVLLDLGVIDETGRLQDAEELPDRVGEEIRGRLVEVDGQTAFVLVPASQTENGEDLVLSQRDVREFQNAKAAVSAGIETLADAAGLRLEEVDTVFLAGGLGTWLNPDSAIRTGLIPACLAGKIQPVGNAALSGAMQCLLSVEKRDQADHVASTMRFIELSGRRDFNDRYVEAMLFGEE